LGQLKGSRIKAARRLVLLCMATAGLIAAEAPGLGATTSVENAPDTVAVIRGTTATGATGDLAADDGAILLIGAVRRIRTSRTRTVKFKVEFDDVPLNLPGDGVASLGWRAEHADRTKFAFLNPLTGHIDRPFATAGNFGAADVAMTNAAFEPYVNRFGQLTVLVTVTARHRFTLGVDRLDITYATG
jgi:hypothetical protein